MNRRKRILSLVIGLCWTANLLSTGRKPEVKKQSIQVQTQYGKFVFTALRVTLDHIGEWALAGNVANETDRSWRHADFDIQLLGKGGSSAYEGKFSIDRFFKDQVYHSIDRVWATGYSLKDDRFVSQMHIALDPRVRFGVMCGEPTAPAFPPDVVTSDASPEWRDYTGKNSHGAVAAWEALPNALWTPHRFHSTTLSGRRHTYEGPFDWTGHSLEPQAIARLGLTRPLRRAMNCYIHKYQMYPMGMWCHWKWDTWKDLVEKRNGKGGRVIDFLADPRILHASLEPTGIFSTTVQETLLSSTDVVARLFRAYDCDASFGLHAVGGIFVSAHQTGGKVEGVSVSGDLGKKFAFSSPWRDGEIEVKEETRGNPIEITQERVRVQFATVQGRSYLIRIKGDQVSKAAITDVVRGSSAVPCWGKRGIFEPWHAKAERHFS